MIVNSSQNIQSSNPLESSTTQRVTNISRVSKTDSDDKAVEKAQRLADESVLRQLRARDREVRAHEAAHIAVGGNLVRGGPSFTFQTGPDGRAYAIGGEVQLDISPVANNPEATISKEEQVRKAALAPANPSAQDTRVAANANQLAARARIDLAVQRREEMELSEKQGELDESSNQSSEAASVEIPESELQIESTVPNIDSVNLQSNEPTAAAISNFMSNAESVTSPVIFSRFA